MPATLIAVADWSESCKLVEGVLLLLKTLSHSTLAPQRVRKTKKQSQFFSLHVVSRPKVFQDSV